MNGRSFVLEVRSTCSGKAGKGSKAGWGSGAEVRQLGMSPYDLGAKVVDDDGGFCRLLASTADKSLFPEKNVYCQELVSGTWFAAFVLPGSHGSSIIVWLSGGGLVLPIMGREKHLLHCSALRLGPLSSPIRRRCLAELYGAVQARRRSL